MINKLYVSHRDFDWNSIKHKFLTYSNYKKIISSEHKDNFCLSIEDFGESLFSSTLDDILNACNEFEVVGLDETFLKIIPPTSVSSYLYLFNKLKTQSHKTTGIEWIDKFNLSLFQSPISRTTDSRQLWIVGCSITQGVGVQFDSSYPILLSKKLNLPLQLLAKSGSSIEWQSDLIARADIKAGDIVIWGITSYSRISFMSDESYDSCPVRHYPLINNALNYWNLNYFDSPSLAALTFKSIFKIQRLCEEIGAKLYLANFLDPCWSSLLYNNMSNYINFVDQLDEQGLVKFLDLGIDNLHPGPRQHQHYADKLFELINAAQPTF